MEVSKKKSLLFKTEALPGSICDPGNGSIINRSCSRTVNQKSRVNEVSKRDFSDKYVSDLMRCCVNFNY